MDFSFDLVTLMVFGFGLIWGSFFNVCIWRMPREESIVRGRSHCPHCSATIPWFHNVPVLAYLWLLGKCHQCRAKISPEYPLVELASGALFVLSYLRFGFTPMGFSAALLSSMLLVLSVIDLHHKIIPDEISLSGIAIGFFLCFWTQHITWIDSLIGILIGGGIFYAIAAGYEKITGREGLGGGDIKLLGMIGAWLGYESVPLVILISSVLGSVVGITLMIIQRKSAKTEIPFGPFLSLATLIDLYFGPFIRGFVGP